MGDTRIIKLLILSGLSGGLKDRGKLLHVNCIGTSSKGKSSVQEHVSLIFDKVDTATSSSAKTLFYQTGENKLVDGGIIRLDEAEGSDMLVIERALTDRNKTLPRHKTVSEDKKYAEFTISQINAVWRNSVNPPKDEQVNNRYVIVNVNESAEQDRRVFERQIAKMCYGKDFDTEENEDFKIAKAITNKIKEEPINVMIPYGFAVFSSNIENRRSTEKFFAIVIASCYCYRYQRQHIKDIYGKEWCMATRKDFEVAREIWGLLAKHEIAQVRFEDLEVLKVINQRTKGSSINRNEIGEILNMGTMKVKRIIDRLIDLELVNYEQLPAHNQFTYWKCPKGESSIKELTEGFNFNLDYNKLTEADMKNVLFNTLTPDSRQKMFKKEEIEKIKFWDIIIYLDLPTDD